MPRSVSRIQNHYLLVDANFEEEIVGKWLSAQHESVIEVVDISSGCTIAIRQLNATAAAPMKEHFPVVGSVRKSTFSPLCFHCPPNDITFSF